MTIAATTLLPPIPPTPPSAVALGAEPEGFLHRFTVGQYHMMLELGVLTPSDRVELLEGLLVEKMPKSPQHVLTTKLVRAALDKIIPPGWHLATQDPVTTADSEPEPDLSVVRGSPFDYESRHPGPGDAGIVVEVSLTSVAYDRSMKLRLYARAGVAIYWIINLQDRVVEVYSQPTGTVQDAAFGHVERFGVGQWIPVILDGKGFGTLAVEELLPRGWGD